MTTYLYKKDIKNLLERLLTSGVSILVCFSLIWSFPLSSYARTSGEEYKVFAKNTSSGEKYVYDRETGKWVLTSEKEETEEQKVDRIYSEYLEKAQGSFENNNISSAREYAEKALQVKKSGREAQFLLARIEQAESELEEKKKVSTETPEVTSMDQIAEYLERARERSKEALNGKKDTTDQEAIDRRIEELREEEQQKALRAEETLRETQKLLSSSTSVEKETEDIEIDKVSSELEKARLEAQKALQEKQERERLQKEEQITQQTETQRKENLINEYLDKADSATNSGEYDQARSYVREVLNIDQDSYRAKTALARIDLAEEKELISKEEELIKKAEKIADYLGKAQANLENQKFDIARNYAEKAASIDPDDTMAKDTLAQIEESEKAHLEEQKRIKNVEEAERQAREEATRKAQQEETQRRAMEEQERQEKEAREEAERKEKIASYLKKSESSLNRQNFSRAASYVEKAFGVEKDNAQAQAMLERIESAEKEHHLEEERLRKEKEEAKKEKKIKSYLEKAAKNLEDNNFDRARRYVDKIHTIDKDAPVIETVLDEINSAEEAYVKEKRRIEEEKEAQERARRLQREEEERARKIESYLSKAERSLRYDKFDKAKGYIEKALSLDAGNAAAKETLARIENAEKSAAEIEETFEIEEVFTTDEELVQRAENISNYLQEAEENLDRNDFSAARKSVQKALEIDLGNPMAHDMLDRIKEKEDSLSQEAGEVKIDEDESYVQRSLSNARKHLSRNKFNRARSSVRKALKKDPDHKEAKDLLRDIDQAEAVYREKKEEDKKRTGAMRASKEEKRKELKRKREDAKIKENINKAKELLAKGDYKGARKHAYRAWEKIPHDTQVAVLLADINKTEMFGPEIQPISVPNPEEEGTVKDIKLPADKDPMKMYDEKKSVIEQMTDEIFFRSGKFELGEKEEPEKEYTIDDCVNIAVNNNQKIKAADEQVKLANLRVWEARRKFFPDVTAKIERGFGAIGGGRPPRPGNAGGGGANQVLNAATRHYQGHKYAFEIKQTVFDGFETWYEIRQTQTNKKIIQLERQKTVNEVVADTKEAYYNLDKSNKAIKVQGKIKEEINDLYDVIDKGYQKEVVAQVDYLKVKGQSMQADFRYVSAREDRSLAEMILLQAMNMDPDKRINIKSLERPKKFISIGLQNCYNLAIANSPEVKIKKETIAYYQFSRKMAKAKGWPKFEFEGSFGEMYENFQPLDQPGDTNPNTGTPGAFNQDEYRAHRTPSPEWYAGITATLPIWGSTMEYKYVREVWAPTVSSFRGSESGTSYLEFRILDDLKYFSGLQQARASFENAKYDYMKAKQDVAVQVKELYFKYRKAMLQMNVADVQVAHQRMFVNVLEERRKYGEMDIPRLVEEYEKLGEYEFGILQADADYFISISELNKAVGVSDYFDPLETEEYSAPPLEVTGGKATLTKKTDEKKIAKYIKRANRELEKKKFDKARKAAIKVLELDSSNAEARDLLASIDQAEGVDRENRK